MILNNKQNINQMKYNKYGQRRGIEKTSNGLGFFIFAYVVTMNVIAIVISIPIDLFSHGKVGVVPNFYMYIISAVTAAFIPGLFYLLLSRKSLSDTVKTEYVRQGELWQIVFIGMAVAMVANYVSSIVDSNFSFWGLENNIDFSENASTYEEIILYFVSTAVVPAFAEEFAFRGILMGSLRKYGDTFAIIASSLMFGAMHGNISQIPFAFILGLILAYVDCKTNSIIPSIIIHFLNNAYAVTLDVLQNSFNLSDRKLTAIYSYLIALFCILGLISFLCLIKKDRKYFSLSEKTTKQDSDNCANLLTLGEKIKTFISSPGIIVCLTLFFLETIMYLVII